MFRKLILTFIGIFTLSLFSALLFARDMENNTSLVTKITRSNLQIVNDMYNSFATGDVPAVLADMATNIEWNESENFPYADGNPYIGPNAVLEGVFKRLGDEWDSVANAQKFVQSDKTKEAMQEAGVVGMPAIYFVEETGTTVK